MPIITEDEAINDIQGQTVLDLPERNLAEPDLPSFYELSGAAGRVSNTLVASLNSPIKSTYEPEEDYNYAQWMDTNGVDPDLLSIFKNTRSAEEAEDILQAQTQLEKDYQTLASRPKTGLATSLFAGLVSPENILIPAIGYLPKIGLSARTALGAAQGAGLAATSVYAGEKILESAHGYRSDDEILLNTSIGAIAGMAVGSFIARKAPNIVDDAARDFKNVALRKAPEIDPSTKSAGAAAVDWSKVAQESNPKNFNDQALKFFSLSRSPLTRGLAKPYKTVKDLTRHLYSSIYDYKDGAKITSAEDYLNLRIQEMETRLHNVNKNVYDIQNINKGIFKAERSSLTGDLISKQTKSADQIYKDAFKYINTKRQSSDPKIKAITGEYRAIIDSATENLKEAGLLTDEMIAKLKETNPDGIYYPKIADKNAMAADPDGFIKEFEDYFRANRVERPREAASKIYDSYMGIAEDDTSIIQDLTKRLLDPEQTPFFLKDRKVLVPDTVGSRFFLKNERITTQYAQHAHALSEVTKMLKKQFKVDSIQQLKTKNLLDEHLTFGKSLKATDKTLRDSQRFIDDAIESFLGRRRVTGEYDSQLRMLKRYTTGVVGGGIGITSLADTFMLGFRHGPLKSIKEGFIPIIKSLKNKKLNADFKADLNETIYGLEASANDFIGRIINPEELGTRVKTRGEQVSEIASSSFFKSIGFNVQQAFFRTVDSNISLSKLTRAILDPNPKNLKSIRDLGFDNKTINIIQEQLAKHAEVRRGVHFPKVDKWSSSKKYSTKEVQEAKKIFRANLSKDVNAGNIMPGKGDIPFKMQNEELFRVLGMFKAFTFAASNKILLPAINKMDLEQFMRLTYLISGGTMIYVLKSILAGREIDDDPMNLISNGVALSGTLGVMGEPIFNALGRGRYADTALSQSLLGPALNIPIKATGVFSYLLEEGDADPVKVKRDVRRLIYMQNHVILGNMMDRMLEDD